ANRGGQLGCVQGASGGQNSGGQNNGPSGSGGGLPAGTWQQSCRDPQLNGTMLTATCLRGGGGSGYSSIDTRACAGGPVGNQNGQLYCEGGQPSNQGNANAPGSPATEQGGEQGTMGGGQPGNAGGAPTLPPGSWQQTCTNPKVNGSVWTASCQRSDGGSRFSAVDAATCPGGRVGNFEGSLACE